jgi:hypothetical protein
MILIRNQKNRATRNINPLIGSYKVDVNKTLEAVVQTKEELRIRRFVPWWSKSCYSPCKAAYESNEPICFIIVVFNI